ISYLSTCNIASVLSWGAAVLQVAFECARELRLRGSLIVDHDVELRCGRSIARCCNFTGKPFG
ncbi:hypothetical protein ABZ606_31085, partial [Streptomyces sp. NPDC012461]|uniref:hypothetical protein n=1 Tax=Streptomyces sp. NPDC012461 TaxID=3155117 RepID=UPI0033E61696